MKRIIVLSPVESPPTTRGGLRIPRSGVTLSEVLISILIMGIGVVSLMTLFPISVLRTIQASQLTNATILRLNAEELIQLYPRLVFDPDYNGNLREHEDPINNNTGPNGVDNPDNAIDEADVGRYVVDPLGATHPNFTATIQSVFGTDDANGNPIPNTYHINRYNGFLATGSLTVANAQKYGYLPDSWKLIAKGLAPTPDLLNNNITVSSSVDTTDAQDTLANANLGIGWVRLTLFSANGKSSVTRNVTNIAGNVISWDDATTSADNLPTTGYGSIQRYRLEILDTRYSWLLTVRKVRNQLYPGQGPASVDVVVFQNRSFNSKTEQVSDQSKYPLSKGENKWGVSIPKTDTAADPKPFLKKGGFVFDAQNAHWYRIVDLVDGVADPTNPATRIYVDPWNPNHNMLEITLDRPAITASNRLMGLPGVIDVFPIGDILYDANNPP